jgi:hypothetical protein
MPRTPSWAALEVTQTAAEGTINQIDGEPEVGALLSRVVELAQADPSSATALPARIYTSPAIYEAEEATLFQRGWLCLGRADDASAAGDYLVRDVGPISIVMLRGRDGVIRSFASRRPLKGQRRGAKAATSSAASAMEKLRAVFT